MRPMLFIFQTILSIQFVCCPNKNRKKRNSRDWRKNCCEFVFFFFLCDSVERMSLKSGYHGRKNLRPSPSSSNMASIMSGRLVTSDLNKSRVAGELAAAVLFRSWAKGRRSRGGVGGICCPRMVKFAKRRARGGHQLFFDGNKRANREVDFPIF
jgi:hypothetical protein